MVALVFADRPLGAAVTLEREVRRDEAVRWFVAQLLYLRRRSGDTDLDGPGPVVDVDRVERRPAVRIGARDLIAGLVELSDRPGAVVQFERRASTPRTRRKAPSPRRWPRSRSRPRTPRGDPVRCSRLRPRIRQTASRRPRARRTRRRTRYSSSSPYCMRSSRPSSLCDLSSSLRSSASIAIRCISLTRGTSVTPANTTIAATFSSLGSG